MISGESRPPGIKIAVVGMAVRVPSAETLTEFWDILVNRTETITRFSPGELLSHDVSDQQVASDSWVPAFGALSQVDHFDAEFFGFTPREIEIMDPQHRIFLETAWRALEDSGVDTDRFPGRIGVFGGTGLNSYLINHILPDSSLIDTVGAWPISLSNDKDFVPTRVAYKLDLQGPAVAINTACSTSLVAAIFGAQSLLSYQSDAVICGGCSVHLPQNIGYEYHHGGILSPDGRCRPFDKDAQGTFDANGAAVVVLRRLEDALNDGDRIYSVISGFGLNNDGALKAGFTAPSVEGQSEVIQDALEMAGRSAASVGYVEAHGTGTALGDEIELKALDRVFAGVRHDQKRYLGSLKSNFGHLDTAAGAAGLIKASLALHKKTVPPTAGIQKLCDALVSGTPPFIVNQDSVELPALSGQSRCAGVSSFGIGGTNAHIVLEEAPSREKTHPVRTNIIVPISAPDRDRLADLRTECQRVIADRPADLAEMAYSWQVGRKQFANRGVFLSTLTEGNDPMLSWHELMPGDGITNSHKVVFLLGGRDTFDPVSLKMLFEVEPEFKSHFHGCIDQLEQVAQTVSGLSQAIPSLREGNAGDWLGTALFAAQYATYQMWRAWGITPDALFGVSLGEFVAATISGVITAEDGLHAVAYSDYLANRFPAGSSVAVGMGEDLLRGTLPDGVFVAVSASPNQTIISGETLALATFSEGLAKKGVAVHPEVAEAPFHSPLMAPWVDELIQPLRDMPLGQVRIPYISCVTGNWVQNSEVNEITHYRQLFEGESKIMTGFEQLMEWIGSEEAILLEGGLGSSLGSFARQTRGLSSSHHIYSTTPESWSISSDAKPDKIGKHLLSVIGSIWMQGSNFNWLRFASREHLSKIGVVPQPFKRESFWVSPNPIPTLEVDETVGDCELNRLTIDEWFHIPYARTVGETAPFAELGNEWVLIGGSVLSTALRYELTAQGFSCITAQELIEDSSNRESILFDPFNNAHWDELFGSLNRREKVPSYFVLCLQSEEVTAKGQRWFESISPFIQLSKRLGGNYFSEQIAIAVLIDAPSNLAKDLPRVGDLFLGPVRVIPQEFKNLRAGLIEVQRADDFIASETIHELVRDIRGFSGSTHLVRNGRVSYEEAYEPIRLARPEGLPRLIRAGGVYLITGGLGRIGTTLARHLITTAGAKVGLTTRGRELPKRSLNLVNEFPDQVLVIEACAEKEGEMREAFTTLNSQFGSVNGVIHSAGIVGEDSFLTLSEGSEEDQISQLVGKLGGLHVLNKLSSEQDLDFVILCSSLSPVLGGLGFSAYASANAVLDRHAKDQAAVLNPRWISINWEGWRESPDGATSFGQLESQKNELTDQEGCEVFDRIMDQRNLYRVIVSTTDFERRRERWVTRRFDSKKSSGILPSHSRPHHLGPVQQPSTEIEKRLVVLWEELLGIAPIGTEDNFFETGGNSLVLTQFIASAREEFSLDLPLASVFESPTIGNISVIIEELIERSRSRNQEREQGVI